MILAPKKSEKNFNSKTYLKLRKQRLAEQEEEQKQKEAEAAKELLAQAYKKTAAPAQSSADTFTANYLKLRERRLASQAQADTPTFKRPAVTPGITPGLESPKSPASGDQAVYDQDLQRIENLSAEAKSALDTYAGYLSNPFRNTYAPDLGWDNTAQQRSAMQARQTLLDAGLTSQQISELAETYNRQRNAATQKQIQEMATKATGENAFLQNVLSVPANIVGGVTGAMYALDEAVKRAAGQSRYSTLDPNLPGYAPSTYSGAVRQTTTEAIDDGTILGKAGATLYGATMSAADNLARIVTLGPTGSLTLAGLSSFQDSVRDVTQRGGTPAQAYAMGVATAGLEVLTEKVSLDSLISTKAPGSITQLLKNAAVQGAIEVSEEELNFAGGLIADAVIMGQNSDFNRTVADLVAGGMSAEEAKRQAVMNNLTQAVNVAAQSFLSGGLMSGAQSGFQTVVNGGFSTPQTAPNPTVDTTPAPVQNSAQPVQTAPAQPVQAAPEVTETQPPSRYVAADGLRYEDMTPAQQLAAEFDIAAQTLKDRQAGDIKAQRLGKNAKEAEPTAVGELPETGSLATPKDSASDASIYESKGNVKPVPTEFAAQLYTTIDGAISKAVDTWNSGKLPDPATLEPAWEAYANLSDTGQRYFLDSASGRTAAFIRAREAGVSNKSFLAAYDTYRVISNSAGTAADHAEKFAAALGNMVRSGYVSGEQRDVLREALSYDTPDGWIPNALEQMKAVDASRAASYNQNQNNTPQNAEGGVNYAAGEMDNRGDRRVSPFYPGEQAAPGTAAGTGNDPGVYQQGYLQRAGGADVYRRDSEGRGVTPEVSSRLSGTSVVDYTGSPLAVYHATDNMDFATFTQGDVGFHFGSSAQASTHANKRNYAKGRVFRVYLNIKNPIRARQDIMNWHANATALYLWSEGVITESERQEIDNLWSQGAGYNDPASVRLREILENKGYDGFVYPNGFEGDGESYIAFRDDQIVKTDISAFGNPRGSVSPDESVGAAPQGFDPYTNLQYQYGNQPDRADDFRPVNVPNRDTYGRKVTEFAANAYGSEHIPDSFIPDLEQLVVEGALGHDTRTNEESFRAAAREIEERGEARSKNDITEAVISGKIGENDVAKALALLKHFANQNGVRAKEAAREMCINVSQLATRSGRDLQLFSTLRRKSPMGAAVEAVTTIEEFQPHSVANRFRKNKDFAQWKQDTQDAVIDMATQIDNIPEGDVDSMRTIIRTLANFRRTTAWFGNTSRLTAIADAMVNKLDFQTAKEIAVAQLSRIPDDFRQRSTGEILKTIRILNMLSSLTTVNRNLVGNSAMALVDGFSDSTVGAALDHLVSKVTNRREVSADITRPKAFMNAATEAAQMAALCAELDIPTDAQLKYPTGRTRTFSPNAGVVSRFFSAYEKYLKYGLEVTDSFFEGGAEATVRASLEKLGAAANLSDEDLHSIARQTAARRTFKDNRKLTRAAQKAKDALNEFGSDNIGLGDFMIPFASVGSNVTHTAIDYSTGGLGGLYEIFTLMRDAKAGKTIEPGRQRKAVTDAARGITGLGLISVFAALASQGVLLVSNDKDWDKRGLEQAEGFTGTQLNLSATIRALEGKDTAYQKGDILLGVDFMEPINAQMRIGYLLSLEDSFADMLQAYPGAAVSGVAQALLDSPLMEGLSDVVDLFDGAIASAAAQEPTALVDAAGQLLGTVASGFIPAPVRQAAQVIDPFYRDTTGGNALEKAANQAIAQIPFASMTLPKKYSGLGEDQRRYAEGDELFAFFNTFIAPGKITQASPSKISGYLNELSKATGSVEIYPDYLAPKSFTFDGKTVEVSGKEMTETYQRTYGENIARIYSDLIATEGFADLSRDMQVTAIKKAKQYATDLARKAVSADYSKSWMEKTTGNEATSIISDVMCAETGLSETRYKAAAAAGISMESMKYVAEAMGNLSPEEGYSSVRPIQQYEAITQTPDLSDKEEEAWLKVYFSDAMDKKLDTAHDMGYTSEMFVQAYRSYLDNDNRKAETVREFQEKFGLSESEAQALYDLYKGTK